MVHFEKGTGKFGVEGQRQEAVFFVERGPETLLPEGNLIKRAFSSERGFSGQQFTA